ncbi:MAG: hypothetical protein IJY93_02665 [Clostridia bacterium]|nr:hypothetical protein [Clostridia bacterium]
MKNAGKIGRLRYGFVFIFMLILTALMFGVTAFAEPGDVYTIADFGASSDGFTPYENVYTARRRTLTLGGEERSLLEVTSRWGDAGDMRSVLVKFEESLDLSKYRKIKYDIYVPLYAPDPNAVYYTRLILATSEGDTVKQLGLITGGQWNTVSVDIGMWNGRSDIVSAQIEVTIDTTLPQTGVYNFYIDSVYADEMIDRELTERFMFDVYSVTGGTASFSPEKKSILMVSSQTEDMQLEADVSLPEGILDANTLRIKLINKSESDSFTLYYSTSDTQVNSEDKSVVVPMSKGEDAQYLYAHVGDISMLHSIRLVFEAGTGSVELLSITPTVQYKADDYVTCGKISSCYINDDFVTVSFIGEVDSEIAIANQSGQIAIYAWDSADLPSDDELLSKTPIVTGLMSARFDLKWKISSSNKHALHSRFLAVILHEGGGYTLIDKPFYLSNPEKRAGEATAFSADEKGFFTPDISLIGDLDVGVTLLEVDTQLAFVNKSEGFQYIYNGKAYYLNETYLDSLSQKITVLSDAGVQVLLRFSGWSHGYADELYATYSADDYINYAKMIKADDGTEYIAALGAYTAENWCRGGRVIGVVYGFGENIIAEGESLRDAVRYTAYNLRSIYMNLAAVNPSAKVYVSLTDLLISDNGLRSDETDLTEYLPLLIGETEAYGQFPWEVAIERIYRVGKDETSEYIDTKDCTSIKDILRNNNCSGKHIIFCDSVYTVSVVSDEEKLESFALGYYMALFDDKVDAYIACTAAYNNGITEAVRLIDTDRSSSVTDEVATRLEVESFFDLFPNYDSGKLKNKLLTSAAATVTAPENVRGRFSYYTFSGTSSIGDIKPGYFSKSLRIVSDTGNVLSAPLDGSLYGDGGNPGWMGIFHSFEYPEDFSLTPILELTIKVTKVSPTIVIPVPVKVVLFAGGERFEALGEVNQGEWTTLYIDVGTNFENADSVDGLQILVGGGEIQSSSLSVKSLDGLSSVYNDESLADVIEQSREKRQSPDSEPDYEKFMWIGGGIIVAAITVIVIVLLSRKREETDE